MTMTTDYEALLKNLTETRTVAENIRMHCRGLPTEFQEKAEAKMCELMTLQEVVLNFARLEVKRIETLQRITLSQMQTHGHA